MKIVDISNSSSGGNFILLGFSDQPKLDPIISVTILLFHTMTLINNTAIILLTFLDSRFHTPMYFFLSNLPFLDICYITSIVPQMLINLCRPNKLLTYAGCILRSSLPSTSVQQKTFYWLSWPMITMQQSANPCTTWLSCTLSSVRRWQQHHG